jgi:hypothetical protein
VDWFAEAVFWRSKLSPAETEASMPDSGRLLPELGMDDSFMT